MTLNTQAFGEIHINDEDILTFPEALPGFPDMKKFVVLFQEDAEGETDNFICFLQSIENEGLSFVLADVSGILPEYRPLALLEYAREAGEGFDQKNLIVYNILTVHDELVDSTANLKAPVVIDVSAKTGRQIFCQGDEYPIRARLFDLAEQKGGACQC